MSSCCGGNCGCGSACKCGNDCGGCKMYPEDLEVEGTNNTETLIVGLAPAKAFYELGCSEVGGGGAENDGCKCGDNCTCNPCKCGK